LAEASSLFRLHLFKLLAPSRLRSASHVPAFGGVLSALVQLLHQTSIYVE
jgi:hypothetical protein